MTEQEQVDKDDEFPVKHLVYLIIAMIGVSIFVVLMMPILS